ncbi:ATP-binding protein [Ornithinibacillus sp. JPR2-1]|uniref:ATP-binding protein n=1 Tax=Ornithinibacillus sp. JPR2-1 TaxID=2094019 RepID=UPI0031D61752
MMEDHEYEFKETSHNPPREIIKKNVAENTVSFLNSHGGRIFYGISNDRIVKGLAATPEEIDDIQKLIHDRLRKIEPAVSGNRYTINFHEVYDKNSNIVNDVYILEIVVPVPTVYERHNIYFSDGKYLYVRLKGAKHKLTGPETVSFIQDKLTKKELDHEI